MRTINEVLHNEHFRWLVDAVPNGMLIVNHEGVIQLVNSELERLFGYDRREVVGQPVACLIPERHWLAHRQHWEHYDGATRRMGIGRELFGRRKDGSEFPVEIGLSQIHTSAGPIVVASIVDIAERQDARNHWKDLQQKEILLKEVHHRVKNNLAVVSSLLAMQARTQDSEPARASLEQSYRRVLSIALVHELLYGTELPGRIDFAEYAQKLVRQLHSALANRARAHPDQAGSRTQDAGH